MSSTNKDRKTVEGFGDEWRRFDQSQLCVEELREIFQKYFEIFPWHTLPENAEGFDLGCGSGRWGRFVAQKVGTLHCIDASDEALSVAKINLRDRPNCLFHLASVSEMPLDDNSMDFGYSLGVLHHIPDTFSGIKDCASKLKVGAPFLMYLYYAFDNRPSWYRNLWRVSNILRLAVSRSPRLLRYWITQLFALFIYLPLSRSALLFEKLGIDVTVFPLSAYRHSSFYTMRTDALDRFGTRLEKRFTAEQIQDMMEKAGLENIVFSEKLFWCALGYKSNA
ncbi:MAG: class I SAM-dependent methyltransferase [Thermoleophilia bacterium]|nr:class I SAM-dependent methyltransferase [Thermoleophilia bacterium]